MSQRKEAVKKEWKEGEGKEKEEHKSKLTMNDQLHWSMATQTHTHTQTNGLHVMWLDCWSQAETLVKNGQLEHQIKSNEQQSFARQLALILVEGHSFRC